MKKDPLNWEMLESGLRVGRVGSYVTIDGEGRDLRPAERQEYQRLSSQYVREDMREAMAHPNWQRLTPAERKQVFDEINREARADAREDLGLDGD